MSDFTIVYTEPRCTAIWIERISGDTFRDATLTMIRDTDVTCSQESDDAAALAMFLTSCGSVEVFDDHLPEAQTPAERLAEDGPVNAANTAAPPPGQVRHLSPEVLAGLAC